MHIVIRLKVHFFVQYDGKNRPPARPAGGFKGKGLFCLLRMRVIYFFMTSCYDSRKRRNYHAKSLIGFHFGIIYDFCLYLDCYQI